MRFRTEAEAAQAIGEAFASEPITRRLEAARRAGFDEARLVSLAHGAAGRESSRAEWDGLIASLAGEDDVDGAAGQLCLLSLARRQLPLVADLMVDEEVRALLYDEFHFVAQPTKRHRHVLRPGTAAYGAQARLLAFRRFPAGQLHFEESGFPRSWLRKVPVARLPATLRYLARMGGFAPLYETHVATRWTVPVVLLPEEDVRSCRRIARTMVLNPAIRGLLSSGWLNDPELARIDPHLAWRFDRLNHGAFLTTVGPAPAGSGASAGNPERARLIEVGEWRPQIGVMMWRRQNFLEWESSIAGQ
jgi:hypothetical protein